MGSHTEGRFIASFHDLFNFFNSYHGTANIESVSTLLTIYSHLPQLADVPMAPLGHLRDTTLSRSDYDRATGLKRSKPAQRWQRDQARRVQEERNAETPIKVPSALSSSDEEETERDKNHADEDRTHFEHTTDEGRDSSSKIITRVNLIGSQQVYLTPVKVHDPADGGMPSLAGVLMQFGPGLDMSRWRSMDFEGDAHFLCIRSQYQHATFGQRRNFLRRGTTNHQTVQPIS